MPWFHEFLTSISRPRAGLRPSPGRRVLAAVLSAMLAFGAISPGVALAGEVDSEGEGSAPPGVIEGGPELEPGAEETVLEELPGAPSGGSEETGEGPPLETEPPQESAPAAPAEPTGEAAQPPVEEASSAPAQGPEYGPAYEPAPASAAVENQPLVAPEANPPRKAPSTHRKPCRALPKLPRRSALPKHRNRKQPSRPRRRSSAMALLGASPDTASTPCGRGSACGRSPKPCFPLAPATPKSKPRYSAFGSSTQRGSAPATRAWCT